MREGDRKCGERSRVHLWLAFSSDTNRIGHQLEGTEEQRLSSAGENNQGEG